MHTKESTQQLRAELKTAFPGVKFSVRMHRGSSVDVRWIDGPTRKEVEAIANKYKDVRYCEMTNEILGGGNSFVFCEREYSAEVFQSAVKEALAENWAMWKDLSFDSITLNEEGNKIKENIWVQENGMIYHFDELVYEQIKDKNFCTSSVKAKPEVAAEPIKATEDSSISVTENKEKGGVEVRFPSKPSNETLESLKTNGFRWSRFSKCWYAKNTDEAMAFAKSLTNEVVEQKSEVLALPPAIAEDEAEDYRPIAPLSIEPCEIWGIAAFPRLNKNNTIALNNEEIERHAYQEDCKIVEIVTLSDKDYAQFCDSFLDDQDWLKGKGTTESHNEHLVPPVEFFHELCDTHQTLWKEGAYDVAIAVTNQSNTQVLIINPQGYDYARYVGKPSAELTSEIFSFLYQPPCVFIPSFPEIEKPLEQSRGYVVIAELPAIKPIAFTTKTPQQELKEKLAALNVDNMSAEQIYDLLQALP